VRKESKTNILRMKAERERQSLRTKWVEGVPDTNEMLERRRKREKYYQ
jgi:hypothetical protein